MIFLRNRYPFKSKVTAAICNSLLPGYIIRKEDANDGRGAGVKKIEAIIRPNKLNEIKAGLARVGVRGMTVSEVAGCGLQKGQKGIYRGHAYEVALLPKIKLEVVLPDELIEQAIAIIIELGRTGEIGDGKIFIHPIEEVYRIRTGDKGRHAL